MVNFYEHQPKNELAASNSETVDVRNTIERINELKQKGTKPFLKGNEILENIQNICNDFFIRDNIDLDECNKRLMQYDIHLEEIPYVDPQASDKDLNVIARAAFNGYFKETIHDNLSKGFYDRRSEDFKPEDYNLDNCVVWQKFKKVPEFAQMEDLVKKGMASLKISPSVLDPQYPYPLNAYDISKIICHQFRGSDQGNGLKQVNVGNIIEGFEGYKVRNTKRFINENEEVFRRNMMRVSLSGKDIKAAIEKGYTKEQAKEYCHKVRQEYVDALIKVMKEKGTTNVMSYKDEKGKSIFKPEWNNQPKLEVHHINHIYNCESLETQGRSFSEINNYENMCFMIDYPYHKAIHYLENDELKYDVKEKSSKGRRFVLCPGKNEAEKNNMRCLLGMGIHIWHNFIRRNKDDRNKEGLPPRDEKRLQATDVQLKELQQSRLFQGK